MGTAWVPLAGARATTPLMMTRHFAWSLEVRALFDVTGTELVVDTQEIRRVHPAEIRLSTRFYFGRGHARPKALPIEEGA